MTSQVPHLAEIGEQDRVAAYSLAVTVLDQDRAGVTTTRSWASPTDRSSTSNASRSLPTP